jgi:polysaccharide export outer membrane protein
MKPGDVVFVGPAGITRWNRVISQLLPSLSVISTAAYTNYSVSH